MLKKRVIPVLLLKNGRMVKGKNFNNYIDTGDPNKAVDIYSSQDADELIFLNISKDRISKKKFLKIVNRASKECSMPLCAGGGITNSNDVKKLLELGADKVLLNSILTKNKNVIDFKLHALCEKYCKIFVSCKRVKIVHVHLILNRGSIFFPVSSSIS